jgi:hypothetical protein
MNDYTAEDRTDLNGDICGFDVWYGDTRLAMVPDGTGTDKLETAWIIWDIFKLIDSIKAYSRAINNSTADIQGQQTHISKVLPRAEIEAMHQVCSEFTIQELDTLRSILESLEEA